MVEFKWIHIFLFLMPVLHFQAITGQDSYVTVRDGEEFVTLPCGNLRKNQDQCNDTDWLFSDLENSPVVELVALGQIKNDKSDRLSITSDCSLVIKNITPGDFGRYTCRQYNEHGHQLPDASVFLSVINMYEDKENDTRKLICSVLTYEYCGYTVELLDEGNRHNFTNQKSSCSASTTFKTPPLLGGYACKVTEINNGNILLCSFTPQSSCKKIDPDESNRTQDSPANQENGREVSSFFSDLPHWWMYIVVASGFAVLLIIVGVVIGLRRTKGNRTPADDGTGQSLNPPETQSGPDTFQETVEFEVPYATISFKQRSNGHTQACGEDDDDDDEEEVDEEKEEDQNNVHEDCAAVTFSSEAASPKDSADLSSLYATVKKKKKADVDEES